MKKKRLLHILIGTTHRKIFNIARLSLLLMLCTIFMGHGRTLAQPQKVTLELRNASHLELFNEIRKQTGLRFVFQEDHLSSLPRVSMNVNETPVEDVLDRVFKGTSISVRYDGEIISLVQAQQPQRQQAKLSGVVIDKQKKPIAGVTVMLKGGTTGAATDARGVFSLTLPTDQGVIVFSCIGYKPIEVHFKGSADNFNVELEEDLTQIDEVVVSTGYFNVDKRHLTSSITSLKMEEIDVPGINTIDMLLEGHVPGMIFMQNSGQVGAAPKIKIRGTTTVLGKTDPLWVLDGEVLTDPVNIDAQSLNDLDFVNLLGNAISGLNPDDIETIDILKDASATAIYGPRASNGVIVLTTKKGKVGKPSISYAYGATFRQRPSYSDRGSYVMNSQERVDYSRDVVNKGMTVSGSGTDRIGYEGAYYDYYRGNITHAQFIERVRNMETANTDWLKLLMNNTMSHKHSLSISGGTDNLRYYTSLGYVDEQGNIKGEENRRYSALVNLNINLKRFTIRVGLDGNLNKREYTPQQVGVNDYAMRTSRTVDPYNEDGSLNYYQYGTNLNYDVPYNIINEMNNSHQKVDGNTFAAKLSLSYKILQSLSAEVGFNYRASNTLSETYYGESTNRMAQLRKTYRSTGIINHLESTAPIGGELSQDRSTSESYNLRASLNFNKVLDTENKHLLNANLIGELSSQKYTGLKITRRGYYPDRGMIFSDFDAMGGSTKYTAYYDWTRSEAARGRLSHNLTNLVNLVAVASYVYDNTYIFNANMRIDASNKFGDQSNERLLPIWSVSGRWNIHEKLVKDVKWINRLALKMSFGYQGNMSAQESPNLVIQKKGLDTDFNEFYSLIKNYPNPDLKWEKTSNYNVELEYSLFDNKLYGSFTYYYRHTKDAFISKEVSSVNGLAEYTVNRGTLENKGFEFNFQFTPVNNVKAGGGDKKGFQWRIDPNFGSVINKLIDKAKRKDKIIVDRVTYQDYLKGNVLVGGRPINTFYSYKFLGLNPENGAPMFNGADQYATIDGETVNMLTYLKGFDHTEVYEMVMDRSGQREPFLQGGISNYFSYRNMVLSFNIGYSFGNKIRLVRLFPNGPHPASPSRNVRKELTERWRYPGDEKRTNIPAILAGDDLKNAATPWWNNQTYKFADNLYSMYDYSDLRVVSGNYIKLNSVSFRYVVPERVCNQLFLKSAYLSFSCSNLFTICSKELKGQSPTQSGSSELINLSLRPTYALQINLTF